jgi:hypothetical protein
MRPILTTPAVAQRAAASPKGAQAGVVLAGPVALARQARLKLEAACRRPAEQRPTEGRRPAQPERPRELAASAEHHEAAREEHRKAAPAAQPLAARMLE